MGAWIEIIIPLLHTGETASLPSWERGLKLEYIKKNNARISVAPLVGAWIEILFYILSTHFLQVAPLVGAWIEI